MERREIERKELQRVSQRCFNRKMKDYQRINYILKSLRDNFQEITNHSINDAICEKIACVREMGLNPKTLIINSKYLEGYMMANIDKSIIQILCKVNIYKEEEKRYTIFGLTIIEIEKQVIEVF